MFCSFFIFTFKHDLRNRTWSVRVCVPTKGIFSSFFFIYVSIFGRSLLKCKLKKKIKKKSFLSYLLISVRSLYFFSLKKKKNY